MRLLKIIGMPINNKHTFKEYTLPVMTSPVAKIKNALKQKTLDHRNVLKLKKNGFIRHSFEPQACLELEIYFRFCLI